MSNGPKAGFWHTVPGLMTATAGFLSAATGALVALNQTGVVDLKQLVGTKPAAQPATPAAPAETQAAPARTDDKRPASPAAESGVRDTKKTDGATPAPLQEPDVERAEPASKSPAKAKEPPPPPPRHKDKPKKGKGDPGGGDGSAEAYPDGGAEEPGSETEARASSQQVHLPIAPSPVYDPRPKPADIPHRTVEGPRSEPPPASKNGGNGQQPANQPTVVRSPSDAPSPVPPPPADPRQPVKGTREPVVPTRPDSPPPAQDDPRIRKPADEPTATRRTEAPAHSPGEPQKRLVDGRTRERSPDSPASEPNDAQRPKMEKHRVGQPPEEKPKQPEAQPSDKTRAEPKEERKEKQPVATDDKKKPSAASTPAAGKNGGQVSLTGLKMTAPSGWVKEEVTPTPMGPVAVYKIPKADPAGEDGAVRITHYPNMKGKEMDDRNIDRWLGQVTKPDGSPMTRADAKITTTEVGAVKLTIVDMTGTVKMTMRDAGKPNHRMIAAIVDHPKGPHFVVAAGPTAGMDKWAPVVDAFLKSSNVE